MNTQDLFKSYKALLTQSGVSAPSLRVLNQDADDFIPFTFLFSTNILSNETVDESLILLSIGSIVGGKITIPAGSGYTDFPIEIKVRQRGTAPVILNAKTSEEGDKVILIFDKRISDFTLSLLAGNFVLAGNTGATLIDTVERGVTLNEIKLSSTEDLGIILDDILTLSFDGSVDIESTDYGLLEDFDISVMNNVPAELTNFDLISAETDKNGRKLNLTFNKNLSINNAASLFTLTNAQIVSSCYIAQNVLTLTFVESLKINQVVTISLIGNLYGIDGSVCNTFTSTSIKNNLD